MQEIKLPYIDFEPFCILDGQDGVGDPEQHLCRNLFSHRISYWVLDDLYKKPERLLALQYLKPKTLVINTTGVFAGKIEQLAKVLFSQDVSFIENVLFFTEDSFSPIKRYTPSLPPHVKFFCICTIPFFC